MFAWRRSFRHLLLALVVAGAQLAVVAHGVDHAAERDEGVAPAHACAICLVGHSLGSAAPPTASPALLDAEPALPPLATVFGQQGATIVAARQRGPPAA